MQDGTVLEAKKAIPKVHEPRVKGIYKTPASEAPEILESISLSRKGNSQNINIAFSNLVGGTITKTTLLCGVRIPSLTFPLPFISPSLIFFYLSLFLINTSLSILASQFFINFLSDIVLLWHI